MENTLSALNERAGFYRFKRVGAVREMCCSDFEIGRGRGGDLRICSKTEEKR